MLAYKGYTGRIEFDQETGLFYGEVANIRDVITFQGGSADEIRREFTASIDAYLAFCAGQGKTPDSPTAENGLFGIGQNHEETAEVQAHLERLRAPRLLK